jgi:hypothetical protein
MMFVDRGAINCPVNTPNDTPFSMGVDRAGIAYSVFSSGDLFRFSTGDPNNSCQATPYVPTKIAPNSNVTFGMGFSANVGDPGETLFIASDDVNPDAGPEWLGTLDLKAFKAQAIGQFPMMIGSAELTGTGDGRLFGFGVSEPSSAGPAYYTLVEFDKTNAGIISNIQLDITGAGIAGIQGWAFAFWGGDFYFFTALTSDQGPTLVSKYHPQPGDTVAVASPLLKNPNTIVGAGVSTCAPQQ